MKKCSRFKIFSIKLVKDWDEFNLAFKSLIAIGVIIFFIVILITIFSNTKNNYQSSIESMFRTTLASIFGFLLSSNFENKTNKTTDLIENVRSPSVKEKNSLNNNNDLCEYNNIYKSTEINFIQILIALFTTIISIITISVLLITNNLDNVASVSQIRVLMSSSIGFLIGETGKK